MDSSRAHTPPPAAITWRPLALVFTGGAVGTLTRYMLGLSLSDAEGFAWLILGINIVGAFLLGLLVESLTRFQPDTQKRRTISLFWGTGVLGGFTTYSALSVNTAAFFLAGQPISAVAYSVGTVACGLVSSWGGVTLARRGLQTRKVAS